MLAIIVLIFTLSRAKTLQISPTGGDVVSIPLDFWNELNPRGDPSNLTNITISRSGTELSFEPRGYIFHGNNQNVLLPEWAYAMFNLEENFLLTEQEITDQFEMFDAARLERQFAALETFPVEDRASFNVEIQRSNIGSDVERISHIEIIIPEEHKEIERDDLFMIEVQNSILDLGSIHARTPDSELKDDLKDKLRRKHYMQILPIKINDCILKLRVANVNQDSQNRRPGETFYVSTPSREQPNFTEINVDFVCESSIKIALAKKEEFQKEREEIQNLSEKNKHIVEHGLLGFLNPSQFECTWGEGRSLNEPSTSSSSAGYPTQQNDAKESDKYLSRSYVPRQGTIYSERQNRAREIDACKRKFPNQANNLVEKVLKQKSDDGEEFLLKLVVLIYNLKIQDNEDFKWFKDVVKTEEDLKYKFPSLYMWYEENPEKQGPNSKEKPSETDFDELKKLILIDLAAPKELEEKLRAEKDAEKIETEKRMLREGALRAAEDREKMRQSRLDRLQ